MKAFPLFINVADRSVIVFGGGEEAAAKLRLLLKTEATVIAIAPHFEAPLLALDGVIVCTNPLTFDLENIAFAAATGDGVDARWRRLRAAGILVCAADQPAVSDFSTPALVDRDPWWWRLAPRARRGSRATDKAQVNLCSSRGWVSSPDRGHCGSRGPACPRECRRDFNAFSTVPGTAADESRRYRGTGPGSVVEPRGGNRTCSRAPDYRRDR